MTLRSGSRARLTPGRVRSMTFRLARLGRRGYDDDDVRDFCDRVEEELALLLEERAALQAEVRRLRGWLQARSRAGTAPAPPLSAPVLSAPVGVPAPSPPYDTGVPPAPRPPDVNGQALRILAKAQQTAERYVCDAHAYSREVAHDAQRRREKILAEASAKATVLLEQAHQAAARSGRAPGPAALGTGHHRSRPYRSPQSPASPGYDSGPGYDTAARPAYPEPEPGAGYSAPTDYYQYSGPVPVYRDPAAAYRDPPADDPGPAADYSTVIDYPGAAADYGAALPDHRDPAGRGDGNSDGYHRHRGHRDGGSRFPF